MTEAKASLLIQLKDEVSKGLANIGGKLNKLAADVDKSKYLWAGLATVIGLVGNALINAADKMEGWMISFETMLGSAAKAKQMMADLREFALKTPFTLPDLIMGTKQLLAFGIEAENIIPTLKALGDVAAGLSVPIDRLILNFGQVKAQAHLTGRELRDFAVTGVPLLEELARSLNKTESEIADMVSKGEIGFDLVNQAFRNMSSEGGRFADLMGKQMKTYSGILSNVQDAVFTLANELGERLLPIAKKVGLAIMATVNAIREAPPIVHTLIIGVGGLVAGITALMTAASGLVFIWPALVAGFAALTSPITLTVIAVTALVTALLNANGIIGSIIESINKENAARAKTLTTLEGKIKLLKEVQGQLKKEVEWGKIGAKEYEKRLASNLIAQEKIQQQIADLKQREIEEEKAREQAKLDELARIKEESWLKEEALRREFEEKKKAEEQKALQERYDREDAFTKFIIEQHKSRNLQEKLLLAQRVHDFNDSLNFISSLSSSKNKELAAIGKAAAIYQATRDTYVAATKALTAIIPPFNYFLAAAVVAAGLSNVDKIRATPEMAEGGIVMPTQGGTLVRIAEAGKPEAVVPLDSDAGRSRLGGLGGITININAGNLIADDMSVRRFAERIDEELFILQNNRQSVSF